MMVGARSRRERVAKDGLTNVFLRDAVSGCTAVCSAWAAAALAILVVGCSSGESERDLDPSLSAVEREVVERFTRIFAQKKKSSFLPNQWLGIHTQQNPNDVWITQEIISEVKPDFIIETGTYRGGSAALWAMVLEQVNPKGRVITIDIEDRSLAARKLPIVQSRVDFVLGSSTAPEVVAEIAARTRGKRVMVLLDSDHSREHVLAELAAYSPLVSVGSYLIVQDTGGVMIQNPNPGPRQALDEFLAAHPEFEPDRDRERMLLTMHPKGYLRRLR
jgi:cephalosporin hydroxylase